MFNSDTRYKLFLSVYPGHIRAQVQPTWLINSRLDRARASNLSRTRSVLRYSLGGCRAYSVCYAIVLQDVDGVLLDHWECVLKLPQTTVTVGERQSLPTKHCILVNLDDVVGVFVSSISILRITYHLSASMSTTSLTASVVRTNGPSSCTHTLSSIRIPIPLKCSGHRSLWST